MDIDSNFDDDYNSINDSKRKKKKIEMKSKKKVTFDCADENSPCEENFDENISDEEVLDKCEDEDMSNEEHSGDELEEEFDYDHEEEFDYDDKEERNSSHEDYSDNEFNLNLLDNNDNTNKKIKNMKEDIYGRIRKPDGTVAVKFLFLFIFNKIIYFISILFIESFKCFNYRNKYLSMYLHI